MNITKIIRKILVKGLVKALEYSIKFQVSGIGDAQNASSQQVISPFPDGRNYCECPPVTASRFPTLLRNRRVPPDI